MVPASVRLYASELHESLRLGRAHTTCIAEPLSPPAPTASQHVPTWLPRSPQVRLNADGTALDNSKDCGYYLLMEKLGHDLDKVTERHPLHELPFAAPPPLIRSAVATTHKHNARRLPDAQTPRLRSSLRRTNSPTRR